MSDVARRIVALEQRVSDLECMVARLCEERAGKRLQPLSDENPFYQEWVQTQQAKQ